jgi:hypothetical protein
MYVERERGFMWLMNMYFADEQPQISNDSKSVFALHRKQERTASEMVQELVVPIFLSPVFRRFQRNNKTMNVSLPESRYWESVCTW